MFCYLLSRLGEAIIEHSGLFDVSAFIPMKKNFSQELQFIHRTGESGVQSVLRLHGPARLKNPGVNSSKFGQCRLADVGTP